MVVSDFPINSELMLCPIQHLDNGKSMMHVLVQFNKIVNQTEKSNGKLMKAKYRLAAIFFLRGQSHQLDFHLNPGNEIFLQSSLASSRSFIILANEKQHTTLVICKMISSFSIYCFTFGQSQSSHVHEVSFSVIFHLYPVNSVRLLPRGRIDLGIETTEIRIAQHQVKQMTI